VKYKLQVSLSREDHKCCEVSGGCIFDRDEKGLPPGHVLEQFVERMIGELDEGVALTHSERPGQSPDTRPTDTRATMDEELYAMLSDLERKLRARKGADSDAPQLPGKVN
jgi:hypothetical protein